MWILDLKEGARKTQTCGSARSRLADFFLIGALDEPALLERRSMLPFILVPVGIAVARGIKVLFEDEHEKLDRLLHYVSCTPSKPATFPQWRPWQESQRQCP